VRKAARRSRRCPPPPPKPGLIEPTVEALIKATGIDFRIGGSRAFYAPAQDYVQVPPQAYFEPINWHRTALHELGHASGAPHRLNRDLSGPIGSKKYAFEELVAEINAAFCCTTLGIVPTVRMPTISAPGWRCCAKTIAPSSARVAGEQSRRLPLAFLSGGSGENHRLRGDFRERVQSWLSTQTSFSAAEARLAPLSTANRSSQYSIWLTAGSPEISHRRWPVR
jgi:hypothetical protein